MSYTREVKGIDDLDGRPWSRNSLMDEGSCYCLPECVSTVEEGVEVG